MTDSDRSFEVAQIRTSPAGDREVHLGRYQLLRVIGRGGVGDVYEAWDRALERRIALKLLPDDHDDDLGLREARYLARVDHPNVVSVHDACRHDGLISIAMELVDGPDLHGWLRERPRRWTQVLEHLLAAGRGLAAVHRSGLVHGDVKPANVLVGRDDWVRVADFGLARVRSRLISPELQTAVERAAAAVDAEFGQLRAPPVPRHRFLQVDSPPGGGTLAYMAPECLVGEASHCRADQFSFCVMAWEALFGVRPFAGRDGASLLGSIAADRIDKGRGRPRGMPARIEAVLRRGLSETPEARWPSMDALLVELEQARDRVRRTVGGLALGLLLSVSVLAWSAPTRAPSWAPSWACSLGHAPLAEQVERVEVPMRPLLERLHHALLLSHVRLALACGEPTLDELTRLDNQLETVGLEAQHDGDEHPSRLRFDLWLARARLLVHSNRPAEGIIDAQRALALAEHRFPADARAIGRALALLASASASASRCELAGQALARMREHSRNELPLREQLGRVLEVIDAFATQPSPSCATAQREAWTLAHKLSAQGLASVPTEPPD